ncbi:hypothetical protein VTN02DRAFT_3678 [Thermoascus thermophilus]
MYPIQSPGPVGVILFSCFFTSKIYFSNQRGRTSSVGYCYFVGRTFDCLIVYYLPPINRISSRHKPRKRHPVLPKIDAVSEELVKQNKRGYRGEATRKYTDISSTQ